MGEYPHCFAACLGQVESFRLVLSRGVDPNATDFNGNNVLHIMVIKDKIVSKQVLNDFLCFFLTLHQYYCNNMACNNGGVDSG